MTIHTAKTKAVCKSQIKKLDEVKGEIERVVEFDRTMIIVLKDGRFAYFSAWTDCDGDTRLGLDNLDPETHELLRAGLITQADYDEWYKARQEHDLAQRREHDFAQYQRLKAKFEPGEQHGEGHSLH
ncbi:MAG TPA: hypothetical protein PKE45_21915 [Caldilineaceae bacterium]|nr:hypothetical protein [Caldilineaceae bacterium]